MTIISGLKSYFFVIVALTSIVGSTIVAPQISNLANVASSSDQSSLIPDASAQTLPYPVDHHLKIKEKVGDPLRIEENIDDADQHCEMSCNYIEYKPGSIGRAGLAFITDTPVDLSGAKKVHFFLMGENGGETVQVKIAGKNPLSGKLNTTKGPAQQGDNLFKEKFALSTGAITLTNDWKRYEVPLNGVDLKNTVAPFGIELLKGKGSAQEVVYLKYVVYENEPVDERFLLSANATTANATTANATTANATTANATTADSTAVEKNNNNTRGQSDQNIKADNSRRTTGADTLESDSDNINDNNDNETIAPTSTPNNSTADTTTSGNQTPANSTDIAPTQDQGNENLAPIAMLAIDSLVAHPGDRLVLDGSPSSDPDGNKITYHWSQSDGPRVDIMNADTVTPTVTIPMLERDSQITIDLVVSDGQTESDKASVVIDVQQVEETEGATKQDLPPDDDVVGQGWSDAACGSTSGIVDCLTDSSDSTFVSSDRPDKTTDLLFSFQDPSSVGINSSNPIVYVTAQLTAKKTGASGFTSLIVDDPTKNEHYSTPGISITSDSFEEYSFTWKNNPVTGEPWTIDSLNSLAAGYRYLAGQGSIQISEFKLIVTSLISQGEQAPSLSSSATDEETSTAQGSKEEEATAPEDNGDNESDEGGRTMTPPAEESVPNDSDVSTDEGSSPNSTGEGEQEAGSDVSSGESEEDPPRE